MQPQAPHPVWAGGRGGKETVRSKVDLEMRKWWTGKRGAKSKQAGGGGLGVRGRGSVTVYGRKGVELGLWGVVLRKWTFSWNSV